MTAIYKLKTFRYFGFWPPCLQTWTFNGQYYGLATKRIKDNFCKKHRFALWNNAACYRPGCASLQGMSVFIHPVKPENRSQWIQLPGYHSCIQKLHSLSTLPSFIFFFSQSQYCSIFLLPFHAATSSPLLPWTFKNTQGRELILIMLVFVWFNAISLDK